MPPKKRKSRPGSPAARNTAFGKGGFPRVKSPMTARYVNGASMTPANAVTIRKNSIPGLSHAVRYYGVTSGNQAANRIMAMRATKDAFITASDKKALNSSMRRRAANAKRKRKK